MLSQKWLFFNTNRNFIRTLRFGTIQALWKGSYHNPFQDSDHEGIKRKAGTSKKNKETYHFFKHSSDQNEFAQNENRKYNLKFSKDRFNQKTKRYFQNDEEQKEKVSLTPYKERKKYDSSTFSNKHKEFNLKTGISGLIRYAKDGHIHKAESLLKKLHQLPNFTQGAGLHAVLLDMYVCAEQLPPALETLHQLRSKYPQTAVLPSKILQLATLMVHHGMIDECIKLLAEEATVAREASVEPQPSAVPGSEDHVNHLNGPSQHAFQEITCEKTREVVNDDMQSVDTKCDAHEMQSLDVDASVTDEEHELCEDDVVEPPHSALLNKLCQSLVSVSADTGDVSATERLCGALLQHGYAKPSRALLGPLVRVHLVNEDYDGALSMLDRLVSAHRCLPCKPELMHALVQRHDSDRLQQLVSLSAAVVGRENTLLDLAICFLEAGYTDKAVTVMQECPGELSGARMLYVCRRYLRHGDTRCLRELLSFARNCAPTQQHAPAVAAHLLVSYERDGQFAEAKALRSQLQDAGVAAAELAAYTADLNVLPNRERGSATGYSNTLRRKRSNRTR